jgi:hypothetical protein
MTRGLLRGVCTWALSLWLGWAALAQTAPDPGHRFEARVGVPVPERSPAQTPQASQPDTPLASGPDHLPETITRQRQALASQRTAIDQAEAAQKVVCWQKFAVNACLSEARRARRQAMEPLRQQELALNAQERLWRTEQRERRLQGKQADTLGMP